LKNRDAINEKERNNKERSQRKKLHCKVWYENNKEDMRIKSNNYYHKNRINILTKCSKKYKEQINDTERNNDIIVNYNPTIQL